MTTTKKRRKAQINFSAVNLAKLLDRVQRGVATQQEKFVIASFSGSYLRYWQDELELINQGIIKPWIMSAQTNQ